MSVQRLQRLRNLLWKAVCVLPLRHRLAARVLLMRWRVYLTEPEWYVLSDLGPNRGTALDIGANHGHYTFALASLYDHVLAFEPNPVITDMLSAWACPRVELRKEALSDAEGISTLFVPYSTGGRLLDGWASFNKDNLTSRSGEEEIRVQTRTLDSLELTGVTFVKMDVEGHEVNVLRGARRFLETNKPTILMEIRPSTCGEVKTLLANAGLKEKQLPWCDPDSGFSEMRLFSAQ